MIAKSKIVAGLLAAWLLPGCGATEQAGEVRTASASRTESPAAVSRKPAHGAAPLSQAASIDRALRAAVAYLVERQSPDGAWRSSVYGPFKEGDALTPLVLATLIDAQASLHDPKVTAAIDKAAGYLVSFVDEHGAIRPPKVGMAYPVYTAAGAAIALSRLPSVDPDHKARDGWLAYLRERQLTESLGWQADDSQYGGWGYAPDLPLKPAAGQPLGNLAEPNISATVFALVALRAAGAPADDPAVQKALRYVSRCQNYAADAAMVDERFDDGGFHFMIGDPVRNKAGALGVDRHGRKRFASYGSATADGLRALALCGVPADDPRIRAAWQWTQRNFSPAAHPGKYARDREAARPAVYFYYCYSLAEALAIPAMSDAIDAESKATWATALARALAERQIPDGSWQNHAVDVREDDPLVATSLAASALARCRGIAARENRRRDP
jgi:squalene-hopene/tetraprenyl-beta-curcumene cyclase